MYLRNRKDCCGGMMRGWGAFSVGFVRDYISVIFRVEGNYGWVFSRGEIGSDLFLLGEWSGGWLRFSILGFV